MKNTVEFDPDILDFATSKINMSKIKRWIYQRDRIILGTKLYKDLYEAKIGEKKVIEISMSFFYQLVIDSEKSEPPFEKEKTDTIRGITKVSPSTISSHTIFKPTRFKSEFVGENLTLEEYSSLAIDEKMYLKSTLLENNMAWLNQKFQELNAAWITVVNGELITYSSALAEYPQESDVLKICKDKGRFPFVFVNNRFLAIEETSFQWSKTVHPNDYYPTVPIQINSLNLSLRFIADFDTGAGEIYVNMARLIAEGLIKEPSPVEGIHKNIHLGKNYWYYVKELCVGIVPEKGKIKKEEKFPVVCICNWDRSPFVFINPNRSALVGRNLFLKIGPSVILQFANRKTEIY